MSIQVNGSFCVICMPTLAFCNSKSLDCKKSNKRNNLLLTLLLPAGILRWKKNTLLYIKIAKLEQFHRNLLACSKIQHHIPYSLSPEAS